ncbi:hypothetical protein QJS10_CPA01g00096 [Acorus calamus]|uniref:Uncharacterized protein n=1 Tax=Acorus calamus TaxID=4465 RepID=A0AAV9FUV5_ACOCL|nr:hypothetical protein QJS10_CPA01g00096 [Acorus calamus]
MGQRFRICEAFKRHHQKNSVDSVAKIDEQKEGCSAKCSDGDFNESPSQSHEGTVSTDEQQNLSCRTEHGSSAVMVTKKKLKKTKDDSVSKSPSATSAEEEETFSNPRVMLKGNRITNEC